MGAGGVAQLAIVISAVDQFSTTFNRLSAQTTTLKGKMVSFGNSMKSILPMIGMYAGMMAAQFMKSSIDIAAEFDHSLHKVQALSGATGEEMVDLEDKIRDLGATTMYTSSQVAEAFGNMAMAGMNSAEMIDASTDLVNLATASVMDLNAASMIALDIATPFRIEYADIGRVVDALAEGFTSAKTSLADLGETMKYLSPNAATAGYTMEQTLATVLALGQQGIRASMAGTSLRMSIRNLLDPSEEATKLLKELGITTVTSAGNLKGFGVMVDELEGAMARMGYTSAEVGAAYSKIFGARAGSTIAALARGGKALIDEYTEALENSAGKAEEVAKIMQKSIYGQFRIFQSAVQDLQIELGAALAGPLLEFLEWFRNDMLPMLKKLSPMLAKISVAFMRIAEVLMRAMVPVLVVFVPIIEAIAIVLTVMLDLLLKFPGLLETLVAVFIVYKLVMMAVAIKTWLVVTAKGIYLTLLWSEKAALIATTIATWVQNKATAMRITLMWTENKTLLWLTSTQWGYNLALYACPIMWIVAAIVGLIAVIYLLGTNMESIGKGFDDFGNKTVKFFEGLWEGMRILRAFIRLIISIGKFLFNLGIAIGKALNLEEHRENWNKDWENIMRGAHLVQKWFDENFTQQMVDGFINMRVGAEIEFGRAGEAWTKFQDTICEGVDSIIDYFDGLSKQLRGEESWHLGKNIGVGKWYQEGTGMSGVPTTGLYGLHEGEIVLNPQESKKYRAGGGGAGGGITIENLNINGGSGSPSDIRYAVEMALESVLEKQRRSAGYG